MYHVLFLNPMLIRPSEEDLVGWLAYKMTQLRAVFLQVQSGEIQLLDEFI